MAMKKGQKGWPGGEMPTGLGPGNDGFIKVQSHTGAIQDAPEGYTEQVGREETLGDELVTAGRGRGK